MYYEEKIINGILMFRTTPGGDWRKVPAEQVIVLDEGQVQHTGYGSEEIC